MFFGGKFKFGPDRNAEGMAIGFGCVVVCVSVCCLNFIGNFFWREIQIYDSEKFQIFGGKFKCKMQIAKFKMH